MDGWHFVAIVLEIFVDSITVVACIVICHCVWNALKWKYIYFLSLCKGKWNLLTIERKINRKTEDAFLSSFLYLCVCVYACQKVSILMHNNINKFYLLFVWYFSFNNNDTIENIYCLTYKMNVSQLNSCIHIVSDMYISYKNISSFHSSFIRIFVFSYIFLLLFITIRK